MAMKFGANASNVDIASLDVKKTFGDLLITDIEPKFNFEDVTDPETGEIKSQPTDEVRDYDVTVYSSVEGGLITVTVDPDANGIEIDLDKNYRKPVQFKDLMVRIWRGRQDVVRNGRSQRVTFYDLKLRAKDFSLIGGRSPVKEEVKQDSQKKG